jgi:hypothetical protein
VAEAPGSARHPDPRFVVICGLPKAGTTLPLTLLDSHPALSVFPEELRFFHQRCDRRDGRAAAEALLAERNVRMLDTARTRFSDYTAHAGTGFGVRDYSDVDFAAFATRVRERFAAERSPYERLLAVHLAYEAARGGRAGEAPAAFVSKAPHNEVYLRQWRRALGRRGRYVGILRDPVEHFYTLRTGDARYPGQIFLALAGAPAEVAARRFARSYRDRLRLIERLPAQERILVTYESILDEPGETMSRVARFAGVDFDDTLLTPTKNGTPWEGNSVRDLSGRGIFRNPAVARERLEPQAVAVLEEALGDVMRRYGYPVAEGRRPPRPLARRRDEAMAAVRRRIQGADRRLGAVHGVPGPLGGLANRGAAAAHRARGAAGAVRGRRRGRATGGPSRP